MISISFTFAHDSVSVTNPCGQRSKQSEVEKKIEQHLTTATDIV